MTWSSNKAFIAIFFFLRAFENSSTGIGSNRASGPSSEIGGTDSGCKRKGKYQLKNKNKNKNCKELENKKHIHLQASELLRGASYRWRRTRRRLPAEQHPKGLKIEMIHSARVLKWGGRRFKSTTKSPNWWSGCMNEWERGVLRQAIWSTSTATPPSGSPPTYNRQSKTLDFSDSINKNTRTYYKKLRQKYHLLYLLNSTPLM